MLGILSNKNNLASAWLTAQEGTHPCPSLNTRRGLAPKENQRSFPSLYSGRGRGGYLKTSYMKEYLKRTSLSISKT